MESYIIIALVVLVVIAAHVALYRWVKFKIDEGVILRFLRDSAEEGSPDYQHADAIVGHTKISVQRVAVVCQKSVDIHSNPEVENSWHAD